MLGFLLIFYYLFSGWQSVEIMIERKLNGKANTVELSKNDPFDCGTKVIGEALVYLISAAILLYGYRNSTINEQAKEDNINKKIGNLQTDIESNEKEIKKQKTVIEKLRKNIVELEDKNRERRVGSCASQ